MSQGQVRTALGFKVHAAWATGVAIVWRGERPDVVVRRRVDLWRARVPESRGPYHAALETDETEGARLVRSGTKAVQAVAREAVRALATAVEDLGPPPSAVGLVAASDPDPSRVRNPHMHAHAAESVLYREALAEGARALALPTVFCIEADLVARAARALSIRPPVLAATLKAIGTALGPPWRTEERGATLAAWLALHEVRPKR
jgi:hypothetical protein